MTELDLQKLAAANLPRYTSYPTAPHFAEMTGETYEQWLSALDPKLPHSLYFHVPFCHQLCWYCGCSARVEKNEERLSAYADLLAREFEMIQDRITFRPRLSHLHWGGGTPSVLPPTDFTRIMTAVRSAYDLSEDAELAIEIDPRTLTGPFLEALAENGITRASLGVQAFDAKVQEAINRIQPYEQVAAVVRQLRAIGVRGINFDLLYGLPFQDLDEVEDSLELTISLSPDRIAAFGYAHVPWMRQHQRLIPEAELPGTTERLAQAELIRRRLIEAGYVAIGIDHFAKPEDPMAKAQAAGQLRRNFQGYTTDPAPVLLALGASAIGRLPRGFVQNEVEVPVYAKAIRAGQLATFKGLELNEDDRLRGEAIERILCARYVDLGALCAAHNMPENQLDGDLDSLVDFERLGLIERQGRELVIPEETGPYRRHLAACFDGYLGRGEARHSKAV